MNWTLAEETFDTSIIVSIQQQLSYALFLYHVVGSVVISAALPINLLILIG